MAKTMILLMDGTANDASKELEDTATFSNVYAINQLIADRKVASDGDITTQITFYLPGVGTKFTVRVPVSGFFGTAAAKSQQIFGDALEQIILRAYVNVCANYHPGDTVIIIGFSRGAAAARIFARLVSDFGILRSEMLLYLDRIWNSFIEISSYPNDADYAKAIESLKLELKERNNQDAFHQRSIGSPPIKFMGLFDTVVGKFDHDLPKYMDFRDTRPAIGVKHIVHLLSMHDIRLEFPIKRFEQVREIETLREIWFPGVHSDVGGGYLEDFLSKVSLLTMAHFLRKLGGVELDNDAFDKIAERLKRQIADKRFVVNMEPHLTARKTSRKVRLGDEVHPVHWRLVGQEIKWKAYETPTIYRNVTALKEDDAPKDLGKWFNLLLGDAFELLKSGSTTEEVPDTKPSQAAQKPTPRQKKKTKRRGST